MIGMVKIGRETNPNLTDTANREGMVLNETYYIFVNLIQECLKIFEHDRQYIYREYEEPGVNARIAVCTTDAGIDKKLHVMCL